MNGWVSEKRFDDMVGRILYAMFAQGVFDHPVSAPSNKIDFKKNGLISQADAEEAIVLLKNEKVLPLAKDLKKIAIIGSHANVGVLSGGGSSQVYPIGGMAVKDLGPKFFPGPMVYYPSSPMKALQARYPNASFVFDEGTQAESAAKLAAESDLVIFFANQWTAESVDVPNLSLPDNQDSIIDAVANANNKTVVVLETGGAVLMPWLNKVAGVLSAWYPGTNGGEAIARVLSGEVNPSGHLPITFPASESQLPHPALPGYPEVKDARIEVTYHEGAAVGYKWFELNNHKPLFPFGFGLSYSEFVMSDLQAKSNNGQLSVNFTVKNIGKLAGKEVAQIYVAPINTKWEAPKRLGAFKKVNLKPNQSTKVTVTVDPRLLAMFDSNSKTWTIAEGEYQVMLASSSADIIATQTVKLPRKVLNVRGK